MKKEQEIKLKSISDFLVEITSKLTYYSLEQYTGIEVHEEYTLNDDYYWS